MTTKTLKTEIIDYLKALDVKPDDKIGGFDDVAFPHGEKIVVEVRFALEADGGFDRRRSKGFHPLVVVVSVGAAPHQLGICPQDPDLLLELGRQPFIIGVEERDPFAFCGFDTGVSGRARPAVVLVDVSDLFPVRRDDGCGVVGRAVVDDDELVRGVGLIQDTVDGPSNALF